MRRQVRALSLVVAIIAVAAIVGGCSAGDVPQLGKAKIAPPIVKEEGKLTVGVDYQYLPYSGEVNGKLEGLDVDVASLIANDLGLEVSFVEVPHENISDAVSGGTVDVAMSTLLGEIDPAAVAVSGVYVSEAPALFSSKEMASSISVSNLSQITIGAEANTLAEWAASDKGATNIKPFENLPEAFDALGAGEIQAVACDAVVGGYLCMTNPDVAFVEQIRGADLIGVGVASSNVELQEAIQNVLDTAEADGRLELILRTWIGDLPTLSVETSATPTPDETATPDATSIEETTAPDAEGNAEEVTE